jgi:small subunit ribosomal protein S20
MENRNPARAFSTPSFKARLFNALMLRAVDAAPPAPVKSSFDLALKFDLEEYAEYMANHFSALKRARQTEKRTAINRNNMSRLRTSLRGLRQALSSGNAETAEKAYREAVSVLDKSVQKGVLHDNTASRYKSRLSARLKALAAK